MKKIELGRLSFQLDELATRQFYLSKDGFTCECRDCQNYLSKLPEVRALLKGFDVSLGIDLDRDVGQGMDELMPHENEDHLLYVVPYYVAGKCFVEGDLLAPPLFPAGRVRHQLSESLSLTFVNSSAWIDLPGIEDVLTVLLEFRTDLRRPLESTSMGM